MKKDSEGKGDGGAFVETAGVVGEVVGGGGMGEDRTKVVVEREGIGTGVGLGAGVRVDEVLRVVLTVGVGGGDECVMIEEEVVPNVGAGGGCGGAGGGSGLEVVEGGKEELDSPQSAPSKQQLGSPSIVTQV